MAKHIYTALYPNGEKEYFKTWDECELFTNGMPGVQRKKFKSMSEAKKWKGLNYEEKGCVYCVMCPSGERLYLATWQEVDNIVNSYSNAKYKKFDSIQNAISWDGNY